MVPKAYRLLPCIGLPVSCDRLAGCRRVDARFTLAIWTLAFGPSPLDIGPVGRLSLSTPVVIGTRHVGAGWCEKPLDQPVMIQCSIQCAVQTKPPVPA